MRETRFQVIAHEWNDRTQQPWRYELLGLVDGMQEADQMAAAHAAEHGTPVDHHHYSISVAKYPDCESLARDTVAGYVRHGRAYGDVVKGQGGSTCIGYTTQIGGHYFEPGGRSGTKLQAHEMYVRVGFDWRVFDLRVLFAEELSGMRQGALL